jgi:hypothetical protein
MIAAELCRRSTGPAFCPFEIADCSSLVKDRLPEQGRAPPDAAARQRDYSERSAKSALSGVSGVQRISRRRIRSSAVSPS